MWSSMLVALVLALQAPPAAPIPTGTLSGKVIPPEGLTISRPAQVILLPPEYSEMLAADIQQRLDNYWESAKAILAQRKELFQELSRQAYSDSVQDVLMRMRRDEGLRFAELVRESTAEGQFEFKNVRFGEYKVLAVGRIGGDQQIWMESISINSSIPQFLALKKRVP